MLNKIPRTLGLNNKIVTDCQKKILVERFQANAYLTKEETRQLATSLNMREKTVDNWFCHMRRVKAKEGVFKGESCSVMCFQYAILLQIQNNYRLLRNANTHAHICTKVYKHQCCS